MFNTLVKCTFFRYYVKGTWEKHETDDEWREALNSSYSDLSTSWYLREWCRLGNVFVLAPDPHPQLPWHLLYLLISSHLPLLYRRHKAHGRQRAWDRQIHGCKRIMWWPWGQQGVYFAWWRGTKNVHRDHTEQCIRFIGIKLIDNIEQTCWKHRCFSPWESPTDSSTQWNVELPNLALLHWGQDLLKMLFDLH